MSTGITLRGDLVTPAVFGGNTYNFVPDGTKIEGGIHLIDTLEANYLDRFQVVLKNKPTVLNNKTGQFSKEKRYMSISRPYTPEVGGTPLVGQTNFNLGRLELETHPLSPGDIWKLRVMIAMATLSPAMDEFFNKGSLAAPVDPA